MIISVDQTNLFQAATIHSISWRESHRAFCTADFIELHTPERQREYLSRKMDNGTKIYMLVEEEPIDYDFYPVDFGENIYEDEEYVELIKYGFISYTDSALTLGIEREDAVDFGKDVVFMMEYLYSIIEGDSEKYNAYFSDAYYKRHDRKDAFTMQKLYDVEITKESVTTVTDKDVTYTQYRYSLVYKIFENNGSFRNDIGDGAKKQYITFTDRDGELLIDDISIAKIIVQKAK